MGLGAPEICRKMGIAEATFYRWKSKYGGLEPSQVRELKQLQEENARLKKLVADLSLDKAMLQDITRKNVWSASCLQLESTSSTKKVCNNVSGLFYGTLLRPLALMELRSETSSKMVRSQGSLFSVRLYFGGIALLPFSLSWSQNSVGY